MRTPGFFLFILLMGAAASGSQMTSYGLGAANVSLANSAGSRAVDTYSQAYNPALMTYLPAGTQMSFSLEGAFTSFEKINQVVVDNPNVSTNPVTFGDVNTKTSDTFMMTLAFKIPVTKKTSEHPVNMGIFLATPVEKIIGIDTEDTYLPQYSMYLADTQHLNLGVDLSFDLGKEWSLGVGGQLYLVQVANAQFKLPSGANSTGKIKMDARPALAANLGLIKSFKDSGFKFGLAYWGKQDSRLQLDIATYIGTIGFANLAFVGKTSVAFDPETYVVSSSWEDERNAVSVSGNFEKWGGFSTSTMGLSFQTFTGSFSQSLPPTPFKDTVSFHGGYERKWEGWSGRLGLAYIPTPVTELNGDANYVDSDKYELALGVHLANLESLLGFKSQLDVGGLMQYLLPRNAYKYSSQIIGAPGYKIGGTVLGYAVTFTTEL